MDNRLKWIAVPVMAALMSFSSLMIAMAQDAESTEVPEATEAVDEAAPASVATVAPGEATGVTVSIEEAINVRSGPGIEYTIRGVAQDGTLDVTGRNDFDPARPCRNFEADLDMWVRVDLFGIEGWMARCIVPIEGDLAVVPVVEPADPRLIADVSRGTSEVTELGDAPVGIPYIVATTRERRINLRAAPSLEADVLGVVSVEGLYVVGSNEDGSWAQVFTNGQFGWMARFLLSLPRDWQDQVGEPVDISESATPEATPEATVEATAEAES